MKLPGSALLEFEVLRDGEGSWVEQTAFYEPKGLFGYLYWYSVLPFHRFIFPGLVRAVRDRCRCPADRKPATGEVGVAVASDEGAASRGGSLGDRRSEGSAPTGRILGARSYTWLISKRSRRSGTRRESPSSYTEPRQGGLPIRPEIRQDVQIECSGGPAAAARESPVRDPRPRGDQSRSHSLTQQRRQIVVKRTDRRQSTPRRVAVEPASTRSSFLDLSAKGQPTKPRRAALASRRVFGAVARTHRLTSHEET